MAVYPGAEREIRIPHDLLRREVAALLRSCGMRRADAETVADSLVHADLRGIHSHGVLRVPDYMEKLTAGGVDPRGAPEVVSDSGSALVVDCNNNLGQVGMRFAMERAIARARQTGVALAAVRGSNHAGTMDYFARMAPRHGMIGLCGTNALPTMAPWGGKEKIVGINPVGIAIPGGELGDFVLDLSFGATAHGKIRVYAQKGEPIPPGWAYDAQGRPTTDAEAALGGLIQPIGGHKGVALGMAIGMLSSLLSGAAYGTELGNMIDGPKAGRDGHFTIAIHVAAFTDLDGFKARVNAVLREVRASARASGIERLLTPGELETEFASAFRRDGIPLNDRTVDDLLAAAENGGIEASPLAAFVAAARARRARGA